MATHAAPAGRGFRIGLYKRDIFPRRGDIFYQHPIYSKTRRSFAFRPAAGRNVARLAATCVLACLAAPVTAGPSDAQGPGPATLRIWSGPEKHPFLLDDLRGARRDLQAFAGKAVVVHFFATWCEPCVREIESLRRLASAAHGKPLAIIAIDVAEVDLRVRAFFAKQPVDFPVLLDRDRKVSRSWDVTALPTTFVLDANLTPKLFIEGDLDWSRPDVLTAVEFLYPAASRPQPDTINSQ
ncbi:TlpA disulfide reductase family protein [Afipia felis]